MAASSATKLKGAAFTSNQLNPASAASPHLQLTSDAPTLAKTASMQQKGFPCTYATCKAVFEDKKAMIAHKINAPEHEYCKRCKLDFNTDDELMLHKLVDPKHIVCPMCGDEFKSPGGRDIHIRTVSVMIYGTFTIEEC
jgi:hypothetical protein